MCQLPSTVAPAASIPLMEIGNILGELSAELRLLPLVPGRILALLDLQHVTFTVIGHKPAGDIEIVTSVSAASPHGPLVPEIYRDAALRQFFAHCTPGHEPRRTILPQASSDPIAAVALLNPDHYLILLAYPDPARPEPSIYAINMIRDFLAASLEILLTWTLKRSLLGKEFILLTDGEWRIALELTSDEPEKLLASRLHLSPHTVHSHIKAVYKKLGVSNRIALINKLQQAARDYRWHRFSSSPLSN